MTGKIGVFDLDAIRSRPLNARVLKVDDVDGVVTEQIRYNVMDGIDAFAYLSYPSGKTHLAGNFTMQNFGAKARREQAKQGFFEFSPSAPEKNFDASKTVTVGGTNFNESFVDDYRKSWVYQYVVTGLRGLDFLSTRPEFDLSRTVVNGFSYSGLVAALLHALDDRPCCYVTWNSSGYFADANGMSGDKKSRVTRKQYLELCPSSPVYSQSGTKPIFIANSITDYFATLDGAMEMYKNLRCPKQFVWAPNRYHADTSRHEYNSGGPWSWQYQGNGPKVATITKSAFSTSGGKLYFKYFADLPTKPKYTEVLYSCGNQGHWIGRTWHRVPAEFKGDDGYVAEIPIYDPSVAVYAVAQVELISPLDASQTYDAGGEPQGFVPRDGGISVPNAVYPATLFNFDDQSDLYFGSGDPSFIADTSLPRGNYYASVVPDGEGIVHVLNIEPFLWRKDLKELWLWIKGDGQALPKPVNLYLVRDSDYYLDLKVPNYTRLELVKANNVFGANWQPYKIMLSDIRELNRVDSFWFELPGRNLQICGVELR